MVLGCSPESPWPGNSVEHNHCRDVGQVVIASKLSKTAVLKKKWSFEDFSMYFDVNVWPLGWAQFLTPGVF